VNWRRKLACSRLAQCFAENYKKNEKFAKIWLLAIFGALYG